MDFAWQPLVYSSPRPRDTSDELHWAKQLSRVEVSVKTVLLEF